MSKRIFKDEGKQALFDKQGFLKVQFVEETDIKKLNDLFDCLHPTLASEGFVSDSYANDYKFKKHASDAIVAILTPQYERLFINYQPFGAAFLYKMPSGPDSGIVSAHQDWTIVDEDRFVALNCWVPLTDINEQNGALQIVPGSHYDALHTIRAPTLPFFFSGSDEVAVKESVPMHVKAGEAVILNQSVIHYSGPNRSAKIRKAITAGVKSKDAPMIFHFKNGEKVELYEMEEDFLINFDNFMKDIFEAPKRGVSKGFIEYNYSTFPRPEVEKIIADMKRKSGFDVTNGPAKRSLLQKVKELFTA